VVLAGVDSPFLVEDLSAFGVVKENLGKPLEVELTKAQKKPKMGFFSKIFN
jgi:hypothetical protein